MLSLEDELAVLDLRYADLLQSVQQLSGCDDEDAEVRQCFRVLLLENSCTAAFWRFSLW